MSVWKRNAVIVAIVLFVGAAVYLNWSYNNEDGTAAGTEVESDAESTAKILGQAELVSGEGDGQLAQTDATLQSPEQTGYFSTARLNRQQARDSALELLRQAATDENADQSVIDEANASIQTMAAYTLSEAQVENLVVAKGYSDCICFIGEGSASVVVSAVTDGLTEADIVRIAEIVQEETGLSIGQIKIIETEP